MNKTTVDNKRIAKNTIFLYIRMLLVMGISIYTVRVVLENLGVVDYGIYNVVGGLSSAFIFFQSALTNATQRFLNFEIGTDNRQRLGQIFNLSLEIYCAIAIAFLAVGSIFGTWIVLSQLSIPPEKDVASCVVLYTTLFTLATSFVASVYEAVILSNENMKIYAYIGLFDAVTKLAVAYLITILPFDKLITYACLLAFFSVVPKIGTIWFCNRRYMETRIQPYWDKKTFMEIFGFSGWNIYGTGVWMINQQGINILLNIFFGPAVNAARGITFQITNVVNNFANNFFMAVRPQIIKAYAAGESNQFTSLIFKSSRLSFYLLWLLILPIFLRIDYILALWLKDVPAYTAIFTRWVLVFVMVDALNNPLWTAIQAVGKLRRTILYGSTFFLLVFPISYIFLKSGYAPWIVYPVLISVRAIYLIIVFRILQGYIHISAARYIRDVLAPMAAIILTTGVTVWQIDRLFPQDFLSLILICMISCLINIGAIALIGMNSTERNLILSKIKYALTKNKKKCRT